ncbi:hypothetical protein CMP1-74 [Clavibacter phage CMP1]|uniref:Uncharacterized protein n=1 Tax=Clavibacter phage CMP1 TaxID=686439 RepID=D0U258_9CAUD|nr:hypothetical protein CMP1-74 [Clavibacter phage CMP1]ACY35966.1 hypothetical protein CMP1-74 [Clavibacter phage CMP1]
MDKPTMPSAFHYPHNETSNMGQYRDVNLESVKSASHRANLGSGNQLNISNSLTAKDWILITTSAIAFVGTSWVAIIAIAMLGS